MLTIFILLILAWQFYIGYSRGLVLQGSYFLGALISLFMASLFYRPFGEWLYLWMPYASPTEGASTYFFDERLLFDLDLVFYAGLAFFVIYLLVYTLIRFLGIFLHLTDLQIFDIPHSKLIAGGLSVLVAWIGVEMVLTILSTIPMSVIQERLNGSWLIKLMIHTPILSQFFKNLWVTKIIG